MIRLHFYILIFLIITFCSHYSFGQNALTQIRLGVTAYYKEPGVTLQYNKTLDANFRMKISTSFYYQGINSKTDTYNNFQSIYILCSTFDYLIFASKKHKLQGFSIGIGPGYTYTTVNSKEYLYGPGIAFKLDYQGKLKNNFYYGLEYFSVYYFNQNPISNVGKLIWMPLNITIGYRF